MRSLQVCHVERVGEACGTCHTYRSEQDALKPIEQNTPAFMEMIERNQSYFPDSKS